MNRDPERLKIVGATDLERRLLDAAAVERPSPEMTRRMGLALGFTAATTAAMAAASASAAVPATTAAAVATTKTLWVWASAGALAAALTAGVVGVWMPSRSAAPAATARVSPPGAAPVTPLPSASSGRGPASSLARPAASGRHHATVVASAADLRGEIALVDAIRAALKTGAPERALALLRRYDATYANGTFRPEAAGLRIEALAASGQTAEARALAREFVAKHPDSPLNDRLTRLTADPAR